MANQKILIIEDNKSNLKLLYTFLSKRGYDVITAMNAEEGLTLINESYPSIILMDLQLPGMDGLQLTKILKDNPKTKDIIIVALTAFASNTDKIKALNEGCDAYISKPINMMELTDKIDSYLSQT